VEVTVGTDGGMARVSVRDHGPGIPPADQQRIFEQFERLPTAQTSPGMGLGLFISRYFVEAHGGRLTVRSEPGAGARFEVRLPALPDSGATAAGAVQRTAT
jgi:signal transduction histidine kinase